MTAALLLRHSLDPVTLNDRASRRLVEVSDSFCTLTGYSREELVGRTSVEVGLVAEDEVRARIVERADRGQGGVYEHPLRRKDGEQRLVEASHTLLPGGLVLARLRDITEQRRTQEELRRSEELLRGGFDRSPIGMMMTNVDGTFQRVNRAFARMVGYDDPRELEGASFASLTHPDDVGDNLEGIHLMVEEGKPYSTEKRYVRRDGETVYADLASTAVRDADGNVVALFTQVEDITARKLAEEQLRHERDLNDATLDVAGAVIVVVDADWRIVRFNRQAELVSGYREADVLGRHYEFLIPSSEFAPVAGKLESIGADLPVRQDNHWLTKSGELRLLRWANAALVDDEGRRTHMVAVGIDITEQQRAQDELVRMRELLERTQEISKTGGWEYDIATGEGMLTEEAYRIHGLDPATGPVDPAQSVAAYDPASAPAIADAFQRLITEGEPYELELGLLRTDGRHIWVRTSGRPVYEDGRLVRAEGNISDVTERRNAEAALRESEERFRTAVDSMLAGYAICSSVRDKGGEIVDFRYEYINDAGCRLNGLARERTLGYTIGELFPAYSVEPYRRVLETGEPWHQENVQYTGDWPGSGAVELAVDVSVVKLGDDVAISWRHTTDALRRSEERFRASVENMLDGFVIFSAVRGDRGDIVDFTYEYANRALSDMVGIPADELVGSRLLERFPAHLRSRLFDKYRRLVETGEPLINDNVLYEDSVEGRRIALALDLRAVKLGDGCAVMGRDITERIRAEQELERAQAALAESEAHYREVVSELTEGVMVEDMDGVIISANAASEQILGLTADQMMGRTSLDPRWGTIHEDGSPFPGDTHPIMVTLRTGEPQRGIIQGVRKPDGSLVWISIDSKLLRRPGEEQPYAAFASFTDITDRYEGQQRLLARTAEVERANTELARANQELESFAYSISHDLRAPLQSMDGFSKLLLDTYGGQLDERGRHYLERMRTGAQTMATLIDELLRLSRVSRSEIRRGQVDLSALARRIAADLHSRDPSREVEFVISEHLSVSADPHLLQIVLENLLSNAWKFTSSRERARIEVGSEEHDRHSAYFVKDNGVGFDMAYAEHLFKPFHRLHSDAQFAGTGIGLASVQRIIARHGGHITATSEPDHGATFTFTLDEDGAAG